MEAFITRRTVAFMRNIIRKSKCERTHYNYRWSAHISTKISGSGHLNSFEASPNTPSALELHSSMPNPTFLGAHKQEEEAAALNEFLERFEGVMRSKLSEAYPDDGIEIIDGMLEIIVNKVVVEIEKGNFNEFDKMNVSSSETQDLSEEMWKIVCEVSNSIVEDMRNNRVNREIHSYLQSEEMKNISRFAKDVGITGDLLRDLKMHFVEEKKSEIEYKKRLDRLVGKESTVNLFGNGYVQTQSSLDKGGLSQGRAKLDFLEYGLDLSDPSWTEIGQRLEVAEKKITPVEPVVLSGKAKAITKQIISLSDDKDLSDLLTRWMENVKPSRIDWLALLQQLNKSNKNIFFKVAEFVLNEDSFEASVRDYTKLLDSFAKEDRLEDAERLLHIMEEKKFARDAVTCSVLIRMYSKLGNLDRAKEAFDEIRTLGLQPDQKAYSLMIMAYVKAGLPKTGESLMREMEAKDIEPGKEVYLALLRAFAERGHIDGAQRIFNTMQFAGIMPNLESCTLLVEAYGQSGDPDQARNVFDHMMKAGHKPDDKCTSSMLAAYEKKNYLDKALSLLLDLEKDGFKPGVETSIILIHWLCKLGLVDEAEQVFKGISANEVIPCKVHVSVCGMYVRAGLKEKALYTLSIVEKHIEQLDSEGFERLIQGLLAGGFIDEAKRMHDAMQNQGIIPSDLVRVALMTAQAIPRRQSAVREEMFGA
ncbi:hypothetical protein SUGI_1031260 [Cryptomeria japonica]|uniref:large ribosomal subunit protein mL101 (rPPR4) n=1 Tax=Cryptomeria japonica TaxID=3369 RepID=UPI0024148A38|nr:large ribosomal subunit protein mL101 (rPPR4) [Cryptomeria japonica]GLJ48893.1 hypothetical protein SUGI_1031260 [Cryptomeria japonica]